MLKSSQASSSSRIPSAHEAVGGVFISSGADRAIGTGTIRTDGARHTTGKGDRHDREEQRTLEEGLRAEVHGRLGGRSSSKSRSGELSGSRASLLHHEQVTPGTVRGLVWVGVVAFFLSFLHNSVSAVLANGAVRVATVVSARVALRAVVALLAGPDDAVATHWQTFAARSVETRERQLEGRAGDLALGVEHAHLVDAAVFESEVGHVARCPHWLASRVEAMHHVHGAVGCDGERAFVRHVQATQVHG